MYVPALFSWKILGRPLIALAGEAVLFSVLTLLIDANSRSSWLPTLLKGMCLHLQHGFSKRCARMMLAGAVDKHVV